jgi:hypothetical protein
VLNIDGRRDADPAFEQLEDILISFGELAQISLLSPAVNSLDLRPEAASLTACDGDRRQ